MVAKSKTYVNISDNSLYSYNGWSFVNNTLSPISGSSTPGGSSYWQRLYKYRNWNTTANWKSILRSQGYLATLVMYENFESWSVPNDQGLFMARFALPSYYWYVSRILTMMPTGLGQSCGNISVSTALRNDAKATALSKAKDMKANVAVMFGEGRQTVRMLTHTVNRLGKAYRAFRKGHFGKAAKELGIDKPTKGAANHWLEYSYGWRPLLSDAKGLAELAAQHLGLGGFRPRFTATGKSKYSKEGLISNSTSGSSKYGMLKGYNWYYSYQAEAHAGLLLEVEYTSAALAAQTGFGLYDPLLLAWELIPFSFVFDWFIQVGEALERMSALQGLKVLTGYDSWWQSSKGFAQGLAECNYTGTVVYLQRIPPKCPFAFRDYYRYAWNGSLVTIRMPIADGLNARRLLTSAALWRQRLRGDRVPGGYHP